MSFSSLKIQTTTDNDNTNLSLIKVKEYKYFKEQSFNSNIELIYFVMKQK